MIGCWADNTQALVSAAVWVVMECCCCYCWDIVVVVFVLVVVMGVEVVVVVVVGTFGIVGIAGIVGIVVGIVTGLEFEEEMLMKIRIVVVSCFETEGPFPDEAGIVVAGWDKTRHKNSYS